MVRWVAMLASWQRSGYFSYAAQAEDAERRFAAGQCAFLTAPPSRQVELRSHAGFDLGVAPLPHYEDFAGARQGGAGVWLLDGRSRREYRAAARFVEFLARPEIQAEWREQTGGARLAPAGYDLPELRRIVDEELEAVWGGKKTALDTLSTAVLRGNELINK